MSLSSQGISKGLRQTEGPQLLLRPKLAAGPFYLATQLKNLDDPADGELLPQIGAKGSLGGFELDASLGLKLIVGQRGGDRQAVELYATAARRFGPVQTQLLLYASPDDVGITRRTAYAQVGAGIDLPGKIELSGALGRRERRGGPDYTSFNLGASRAVGALVRLDLRYYDTAESSRGEVYRGRFVASVRGSF
jgi:hypothetical protein